MKDKKEPGFAEIIGGVKRLHSDRADLYAQRVKKPAPSPRADMPEQQDPFQSPSLGASEVDSARFNPGLQKKLQRRIRQGLIRPESTLDLHGYRQQQALPTLAAFIAEALRSQQRLVVVIHGQGFRSQTDPVLKPAVHKWLASQSQVLAWCPARPRDGGAGASYVYLRLD